jgi:hypothetical protein
LGPLDGGAFLRAPEKYFYELFERINVLADCGTPSLQRGWCPGWVRQNQIFWEKILKDSEEALMLKIA